MIELIRYNKAAFTLIEITIALLILAVGLVGILSLFPVGFDASGRAASITVATFLAQELIEDLKKQGYDVALLAGTQDTPFDSPYAQYEYAISVNDGISGALLGSICEVTVTVYWPAEAGDQDDRTGQRSVELITYIAKYEP